MMHTTIAVLLGVAVLAGADAGAASRTFVSGTGSDANACTRTAPCRNFQRGIDAVDAGGEVVALDSAGYGTFTVTKSVSVIAPPEIYGGVTATTSIAAIHVDTKASNVVVVLRGLSITGLGASDGILARGGLVFVEHCTVSGFLTHGLEIQSESRVFVKDSTVRSNLYGLTAMNSAIVSIQGSRLVGNTLHGVSAGSDATVTVADSVLSGNDLGGWVPVGSAGATLSLVRSRVTGNGDGLECNDGRI